MADKFTQSQFNVKKIMTGRNKGKYMVRFKSPGQKTFHTLSIVDTQGEGRTLITRMKSL